MVTRIEQALAELSDDDRRTDISRSCRTWSAQFTWSEMHRQLTAIAREELVCAAEEPAACRKVAS